MHVKNDTNPSAPNDRRQDICRNWRLPPSKHGERSANHHHRRWPLRTVKTVLRKANDLALRGLNARSLSVGPSAIRNDDRVGGV
jgi:hypothetical protein